MLKSDSSNRYRLSKRTWLEIVGLVFVNVVAFVLFGYYDAFAFLCAHSRIFGFISVGEFIPLVFVFNGCLLVILARRLHEQSILKDKLLETATHDFLTGLYNRASIQSQFEDEIARVGRHYANLSLLLLDIDDFKRVNDTFGHAVGDIVLKEFTQALSQSIRQTDSLARWGGEEFIILCRDTDIAGARTLAEKVSDAIRQCRFTRVGILTTSVGIASYRMGEGLDEFVRRADERLYVAKRRGKNTIVGTH